MPQGLVCGSDHLTMDRFVGLETGWLQMDDSSPNGYEENKTPLVGEFDIEHLNNELSKVGNSKITNEVVDTLSLARDKFPGSSVNLDALCKRYRIDNSKRKKHTALIDCDLLSKVYINLIDQKEPKLNFSNEISDNNQALKTNISYFKKIVKPSEDEKRNHEQYLKINLKKNFFN